MPFIADIGAVLRLTPHDDLQITDWSPTHRWAELAYDLSRAHWGKGLMCQAVAAVLDWTFRQDRVDRVHAYVRGLAGTSPDK
jgi:RimJ/RimL family protein N-acetyltransferase